MHFTYRSNCVQYCVYIWMKLFEILRIGKQLVQKWMNNTSIRRICSRFDLRVQVLYVFEKMMGFVDNCVWKTLMKIQNINVYKKNRYIVQTIVYIQIFFRSNKNKNIYKSINNTSIVVNNTRFRCSAITNIISDVLKEILFN